MLKALKYKDNVLEWFYLDDDDITIKRKKNGYRGRYKKHDIVKPYRMPNKKGYEYTGIHIPKTNDSIATHWVLTILRRINFEDGQIIDHINGDPNNNRRENIRITTQSENCKNRKLRKDNSTGYAGICFDKQSSLFLIRKQINGKRKYASTKTLQEAIAKLEEFKIEAFNYGEIYIQR